MERTKHIFSFSSYNECMTYSEPLNYIKKPFCDLYIFSYERRKYKFTNCSEVRSVESIKCSRKEPSVNINVGRQQSWVQYLCTNRTELELQSKEMLLSGFFQLDYSFSLLIGPKKQS